MTAPAIDGPRACTRAEVPEVIALVDSAMRQNSDQSMRTDYPLVYQDDNLANIRILKVDGELASVVPFIPWPVSSYGGSFDLGIVSPTATAARHRKKGYGLACLNDCVRQMERSNCLLSTLWTLPATFGFYKHADFQPIPSPGWIYHCRKADARLWRDNGEKIVTCNPRRKGDIYSIPLRQVRGNFAVQRYPDRWETLLQLPKMKTLFAWRDDATVGYMMVSRAIHKPGIVEARGDASALETLMGHVLSDLQDGEIIPTYAYRTRSTLRRLLESKIPKYRVLMPAGQMMRINKPCKFFHEIIPWLARKNRGVRRSFSLSIAGETIGLDFRRDAAAIHQRRLRRHFTLSRRELVSLVFGVHPAEDYAIPPALADLFPFYFPIPMLDRS